MDKIIINHICSFIGGYNKNLFSDTKSLIISLVNRYKKDSDYDFEGLLPYMTFLYDIPITDKELIYFLNTMFAYCDYKTYKNTYANKEFLNKQECDKETTRQEIKILFKAIEIINNTVSNMSKSEKRTTTKNIAKEIKFLQLRTFWYEKRPMQKENKQTLERILIRLNKKYKLKKSHQLQELMYKL